MKNITKEELDDAIAFFKTMTIVRPNPTHEVTALTILTKYRDEKFITKIIKVETGEIIECEGEKFLFAEDKHTGSIKCFEAY